MFVGTVFFEVLIMGGARKYTSARLMDAIESALSARIVKIVPIAVVLLYLAGLGMVGLRFHTLLAQPFASAFACMLWLKILLAVSVFAHFLIALIKRRRGTLSGHFSKWLHWSVFAHVVLIVLIAKWMFYI